MADCYIVFKPSTIYVTISATHASLGNAQTHGSEGTYYGYSSSFTFTVPSGITITEAYLYHTCSSSTTSSYQVTDVTSSAWTNFLDANDNLILRTYGSGNSTTTISFTGQTCKINCVGQITVIWADVGAPGTTCSITRRFTFNPYLRLKVTIPTAETLITAENLNAFAAILNTSTVTVGDLIVRAPWQAIGTAIGTMKTTIDGNTNASAVTFDSTKPLSSNLQSVITNMTNKYLIRSS